MNNKKALWINLCLINLSIVALLGFVLRSKILFSLPFINYRNVLSAHSHFAFGGWAGLGLITLLIYEILPADVSNKKIYQWILAGFEVSSLGMAFTFPFEGYAFLSIFFSTLYIFAALVFAWIFIRDILKRALNKNVKLLSVSAISSLIISFSGTLGLVYILLSKSGNSLLYRDSIYVFLHFQYNGFFALSVFALFLNLLAKKNFALNKARLFAVFLCLSIVPSLFLALLWHNSFLFYILAAIGCLLILITLIYFFSFPLRKIKTHIFSHPVAGTLWMFSFLSFALKMILQIGTIIPQLGNAVYGDRPVIIGFLHLVFLGFVTFYILSSLINMGYFSKNAKPLLYPFYIFSFAVIFNETVLMLQGLGVLFKTNSFIYNWILWIASILLFTGSLVILTARLAVTLYTKRKDMKVFMS